MNKRSLGALIVLNVVLLAGLLVVGLSAPASAQLAGGGDYVMVAGSTRGRAQQEVIYIVDTRSSRTVALFFNSSNNRFEAIGGRHLGDDINVRGGNR